MTANINLQFNSPYRSIKGLTTVTIPSLTVITGPNGCGKTHLLSAIESGNIKATDENGFPLKAKVFNSTPQLSANNISHQNLVSDRYAGNDAKELIEAFEALLRTGVSANILTASRWESLTRATLMATIINRLEDNNNIQFSSGDAYTDATHSPATGTPRRNRWEAFKKFVPLRAIRHLREFNEGDLKSAIFDFIQYQTFMSVDMSIIFYRYFEELQDNLYRRHTGSPSLSDEDFISKFGNAPWDEVNSLLERYDFRHRVVPPSREADPRATNGYQAKIVNEDGDLIDVEELSSGERVIIALLLSAYAAQQNANGIIQVDVPDIILFDEIDAHLHPGMTRMMFDVIINSVMNKLRSRVVLTTHSPSTVALAQPDAIHQLLPGSVHVLEKVDVATACRDLTDGFIQLLDGSQIVIVEGKDDPLFYRAIEKALRTSDFLGGLPSLHFVAASKTDDPSTGGGSKAAEDWAQKLNTANLPNIHALLDNDGHRAADGIIKVLDGRYAIENFVLDPLSLAITLVTDARLESIDPAIGAQFPNTKSISSASESELQLLANAICAFIESKTMGLATGITIEVEYCNGYKLQLPDWIANKRGKDLVRNVRDAFKTIEPSYIITRSADGVFNIDGGYLLKLWVQHPQLFPASLKDSLLALAS